MTRARDSTFIYFISCIEYLLQPHTQTALRTPHEHERKHKAECAQAICTLQTWKPDEKAAWKHYYSLIDRPITSANSDAFWLIFIIVYCNRFAYKSQVQDALRQTWHRQQLKIPSIPFMWPIDKGDVDGVSCNSSFRANVNLMKSFVESMKSTRHRHNGRLFLVR